MNEQTEVIPGNYEAWRQCITVHCGIPLTSDFIAQRIHALSQDKSEETMRFRKLYGEAHWRNVISWYQQALAQLA